MPSPRSYWLWQLVGWAVAPAAVVGVTALAGGSFGFRNTTTTATVVFSTALLYATYVGGSHGVHLIATRLGWFRTPRMALALRLALAVVAMAFLANTLNEAVQIAALPLVNPAARRPIPTPRDLVGDSLMIALALGVWAMVYGLAMTRASLRSAEHDRLRLQAALADARTEALERQLNPHFLFNALNTVRSLVTIAPLDARRAVTLLASVLRQTLTSGRDAAHSLGDELRLVEAYLEIETMRFKARIRTRIEASPDARAMGVPALMVLTLVENGVKHGVARRRDGGEVAVVADVSGGRLTVTVSNPLPTSTNGREPEGTGTGLANARERLALMFGDRADLTLTLSPHHAVARLDLPAVGVEAPRRNLAAHA